MKSCDQDFCFVASRRAETEGLERFEYIVAVSVINLLLFVVEKGSSCRIFQQPVKLFPCNRQFPPVLRSA